MVRKTVVLFLIGIGWLVLRLDGNWLRLLAHRSHATEAEMIRAGVDLAFAARADDVARAILVVAKKRAAAMHALLLVRLRRIKWGIRTLRIVRDTAFVRKLLVVIRAIPIATP